MPTPVLSFEERQREQLMLRELQKFHREHAHVGGPLLTAHTKKRERVPHVDVDANPFCMERQLADEYERLNFNKNPRFYMNTISSSPRILENRHNHSSFINDAADIMASSGFAPGARPEFTGAAAPVAYRPSDYSPPSVITVDPRELRSLPKNHALHHETNTLRAASKHTPPTHPHYATQRTLHSASFGHRPESASRMYDPLTSTVIRSKKATPVKHLVPMAKGKPSFRVGMNALDLQELLTPTKLKQQPPPESPAQESPTASLPMTRNTISTSTETTQRRRSSADETPSREELERGFNNQTYYPPKAHKDIRFQPPTDQTTAQLIDKFRKLAVGKLPEP